MRGSVRFFLMRAVYSASFGWTEPVITLGATFGAAPCAPTTDGCDASPATMTAMTTHRPAEPILRNILPPEHLGRGDAERVGENRLEYGDPRSFGELSGRHPGT